MQTFHFFLYALLTMRFSLMAAIVQIALWQFSQSLATIFMVV